MRRLLLLIIFIIPLWAQHFERWLYLPEERRMTDGWIDNCGWDGENKLYLGNCETRVGRPVIVYNISTGQFKPITSQTWDGVDALIYNPRTNLMYGCGWPEGLYVIDCERDTIILTLPYLPTNFVVNTVNNKLYLRNYLDNQFYILNGSDHRVIRTYPGEFVPLFYDSINNKIALLKGWSNRGLRLYILDGETDELIDSSLLSQISHALRRIAFNQNNKFAYFLGEDTTFYLRLWLYVYDMTRNRVLDSLRSNLVGGELSFYFLAVNTVNNKVYLSGIVEVETTEYAVFYTLSESLRFIDSIPHWLICIGGFNPKQNILYAPSIEEIFLIDGETNRLIDSIPINPHLDSYEDFLLLPEHNLLFLLSGWNLLSVVDLERRKVARRITFGHNSHWSNFTYNPLNDRLYWTGYIGLPIIEEATGNLVKEELSIYENTGGVFFEPLNRVYITGIDTNSVPKVFIFDATTDSLTGEVPLPLYTCPGPPFYNPQNHRMYFLPMGYLWAPIPYRIVIFNCDNAQCDFVDLPNWEAFINYYDIAVNWQENKLYFFDGTGEYCRTAILNMNNNQIIWARETLIGFTGAWASRHNRIYASAFFRDSLGNENPRIAIMDGHSDSIIGYISGVKGNSQIIYDSIDDKIYAFGDSGLFSIACSTNTIQKRFPIFPWHPECKDLLWNPQTNHLFVIHQRRDSSPMLYVIDCLTDSIIASFSGFRFEYYCVSRRYPSLLLEKNRVYIGEGKIMVIRDEPSGIAEKRRETEETLLLPTILRGRSKLKLPWKGEIRICLYDASGREYRQIRKEFLKEGILSLGQLSPGVYWLAIEQGGRRLVKKIVIIGQK